MIIIKEVNETVQLAPHTNHVMSHILQLVGSDIDHCFCFHCRDHMVEILFQRGYKPVLDGKQIQVTQPDGMIEVFLLTPKVKNKGARND